MLAIGTRPEAIKLAPVAIALRAIGIDPALVLTGQHPVRAGDHGIEGCEVRQLSCPGGGDPNEHVSRVTAAARPALHGAHLVVVQGDTSSALGCALAASALEISIAHVEAGLRSHDRLRPWPEEGFRIEIDRRSDLLFAPTQLSAANLRREKVGGGVHVTGNSGIDAVLHARRQMGMLPIPDRSGRRMLVTCHRRESWGRGLSGIAGALRLLAARGVGPIEVLLHPNPATAAQLSALLQDCEAIILRPPLSHRDTVEAMLAADFVLSDSGGLQEECAALGIPLLVLRDRTERPEAIACGAMTLVGTAPNGIVEAVQRMIRKPRPHRDPPAQPYGDGRAGDRIASIIADWLVEKGIAFTRGYPGDVSSAPRMKQDARQGTSAA